MKSWKIERLRRQARKQRRAYFKQLNSNLTSVIKQELFKIYNSTILQRTSNESQSDK